MLHRNSSIPAELMDSFCQSPPLSVIWVYTIIQLNLTPAIISLGVVYGLVKFLKLKIVFN